MSSVVETKNPRKVATDCREPTGGGQPPPRSEGRARSGGAAALGIITKSSAALREVLDEETGEIQWFRLDPKRREYVQVSDPNEAREGRYMLQNSARKILQNDKTPRDGDWRVCSCLRKKIGDHVAVLYAPDVQKAHFGNLQVCGSVWTCPVCSAKVSERRKSEIVAATDIHKAAGGGLYMVTLTWAHTRHDDVKTMVKGSREALTRLRKHRRYVSNMAAIGAVGMIRALEVTHGDANGWHPHFHELHLTAERLTRRQLRAWTNMLFEEWRAQCKRAGLGEPNRKAGVTIIEAQSAAEYVAKFGNAPKWGVGSELTKTHAKHGRGGSRTPWDLLRMYAEGQGRFAPLFKEYAHAFFGARQVFWSPGLKAQFEIADMTDEEIARMEEHPAQVVCQISADDWKKVLSQVVESRALILRLAETGGADAIETFIAGLANARAVGK